LRVFSAAFIVVEAAGAAMNDPDVILFIGPQTDGPAEQPVVGEWLWPERIDFKPWGRDA